MADFIAEWTEAPGLKVDEDRSLSPGSEAPDGWVMYFDMAFSRHGAGAGAVTEDRARLHTAVLVAPSKERRKLRKQRRKAEARLHAEQRRAAFAAAKAKLLS